LLEDGIRRLVPSLDILTGLQSGVTSTVLTVRPAYLTSIPQGAPMLAPGRLVKGASSASIYLFDKTRLVPLSSFGPATDAGIPGTYTTVASADLAALPVAAASLRNVITCLGQTWIAASGQLWRVDPAVVSGLASTALDDATCTAIRRSTTVLGDKVFLKSASSAAVYQLVDGVKRPILTMATVTRLSAPNPAVIISADNGFVSSIPTGPAIVDAGMLVKGSSASIYLIDGVGGRIPVPTFDAIGDLGLSTAYITVSDATLNGLAVAPLLSNFVRCDGVPWLAASGKLWRISESVVGAVPVTEPGPALCAVLKRSATSMEAAAIVKSPSSASLYLLANGQKQPISTWSIVVALSGGTYTTVNAWFLGRIPTGAMLR
jgi:hypothetical protein